MTDAPERVWITEFTHGDRSWTDNAKIGKYRKEMEYIRADIHEAEIERLRAEVDKWKHAFAVQSEKLQSVLHIEGVRAALIDKEMKDE